ncbi:sialidase family protein [Mucilaginibacter ginsenosidivorans]|uniref:Exo-alpha-sialidase n=1 Tax=Mucilaginibacter ginsenosidivorans TaxID=398053 RepID=A0A5B8UVA0_9SPHI|nr:sialidase family protein [Mucilaginibacter ginsenosidivorans]QEC62863.1 exo-alpha-sialidase [Mucilaginibacter ginsenosidivorans]
MNKGLFLLIFASCAVYFGCFKSSSDKSQLLNTVTLKISLVSGDGQTDTIGNTLPAPVVVKVLANDVPQSGYSVQFKGSGCGRYDTGTVIAGKDGLTAYSWSLTGDVGQQTLTAYVLNADNQKVDSVKIKATAIAGGPGWHNGGCSLQTGLMPTSFCKLSSGRIFTSFTGGKTYLRYSDDNGVNWYAVASLGDSHQVNYVISNALDEVYALTSDGVFYSTDAGQSWANAGAAPFDAATINAAIATPGGKLMVTTSEPAAAYVSADKGKTWTTAAKAAFPEAQPIEPYFNCPAEDKEGNLYVTDVYNMNLFKSGDAGATWYAVPIGGSVTPGIFYSFYIDPANNFYVCSIFHTNGIYISEDEGTGYTGYMTSGQKYSNMSVQSDGKFYFEDDSNGLYVFNSYNNSTLIFPFKDTGLQPYIVAKNGNMIVANWGKPYIRYYSK